jgi:translation initiation factor IF-2
MDKISQWENVHLKLLLKADSFGSLEACKYALSKIEMPENIELKLIHNNIWSFNISDIMLAQASWAILLWFNIPIKQVFKKKTEQLKVTMKSYDIIYELVSYIEWIAQWLIKHEEVEVITWKLNVLWIFFRRWKEMVIWWKVIEWKILNNSRFRIHREDEIIGWGKITSLKRDTENVNEVKEGYDCWIKIKTDQKIIESDVIEFYIME